MEILLTLLAAVLILFGLVMALFCRVVVKDGKGDPGPFGFGRMIFELGWIGRIAGWCMIAGGGALLYMLYLA